MNEIRRVITGNVKGKSVFTRDDTVKQTTVSMVAGGGFTRVYGCHALTLPNNGNAADIKSYFPPAGGATVTILTLPPDPKSPHQMILTWRHLLMKHSKNCQVCWTLWSRMDR